MTPRVRTRLVDGSAFVQIRLTIGQCFASREGAILQTLLGSCVSVCLFDPSVRVGGMNHILLPGKADFRTFNEPARYGINAMELLVNEMCKLGGARSRMQAKVFGGANVLGGISQEKSPGPKNVEFVREYLLMEGIPLLKHDTGGLTTRIIQYHTDTFEVFVKRIPPQYARQALDEEKKLSAKSAENAARKSDVVFFSNMK